VNAASSSGQPAVVSDQKQGRCKVRLEFELPVTVATPELLSARFVLIANQIYGGTIPLVRPIRLLGAAGERIGSLWIDEIPSGEGR
jgi:hypothetical protein